MLYSAVEEAYNNEDNNNDYYLNNHNETNNSAEFEPDAFDTYNYIDPIR